MIARHILRLLATAGLAHCEFLRFLFAFLFLFVFLQGQSPGGGGGGEAPPKPQRSMSIRRDSVRSARGRVVPVPGGHEAGEDSSGDGTGDKHPTPASTGTAGPDDGLESNSLSSVHLTRSHSSSSSSSSSFDDDAAAANDDDGLLEIVSAAVLYTYEARTSDELSVQAGEGTP